MNTNNSTKEEIDKKPPQEPVVLRVYRYEALNSAGKIVEGSITTKDLLAAISGIKALGFYPTRVYHRPDGRLTERYFATISDALSSPKKMRIIRGFILCALGSFATGYTIHALLHLLFKF